MRLASLKSFSRREPTWTKGGALALAVATRSRAQAAARALIQFTTSKNRRPIPSGAVVFRNLSNGDRLRLKSATVCTTELGVAEYGSWVGIDDSLASRSLEKAAGLMLEAGTEVEVVDEGFFKSRFHVVGTGRCAHRVHRPRPACAQHERRS